MGTHKNCLSEAFLMSTHNLTETVPMCYPQTIFWAKIRRVSHIFIWKAPVLQPWNIALQTLKIHTCTYFVMHIKPNDTSTKRVIIQWKEIQGIFLADKQVGTHAICIILMYQRLWNFTKFWGKADSILWDFCFPRFVFRIMLLSSPPHRFSSSFQY